MDTITHDVLYNGPLAAVYDELRRKFSTDDHPFVFQVRYRYSVTNRNTCSYLYNSLPKFCRIAAAESAFVVILSYCYRDCRHIGLPIAVL